MGARMPTTDDLVERSMVIFRALRIEKATEDAHARDMTLTAAQALGHDLSPIGATREGCLRSECLRCHAGMAYHECGLSFFVEPDLYRQPCPGTVVAERLGTMHYPDEPRKGTQP